MGGCDRYGEVPRQDARLFKDNCPRRLDVQQGDSEDARILPRLAGGQDPAARDEAEMSTGRFLYRKAACTHSFFVPQYGQKL